MPCFWSGLLGAEALTGSCTALHCQMPLHRMVAVMCMMSWAGRPLRCDQSFSTCRSSWAVRWRSSFSERGTLRREGNKFYSVHSARWGNLASLSSSVLVQLQPCTCSQLLGLMLWSFCWYLRMQVSPLKRKIFSGSRWWCELTSSDLRYRCLPRKRRWFLGWKSWELLEIDIKELNSHFGRFDFSASCTPGQVDWWANICQVDPAPQDRVPVLRRPFFQSYTLAAAGLRARLG